MAQSSSSGFGVAILVVKLVAMVVGFVGTLLLLMSWVGALTDNGWIRSIVGVVVAIAVPLAIGDRLLPADPSGSGGIVTDALAIFWLGLTFLFAVPLQGLGSPALVREGDRLRLGGWEHLANAAYALAGVETSPAPSSPAPSPSSSSSSSSSSSVPSSGPPPTASAAPALVPPSSGSSPPPAPAAASKDDKTAAELFKDLAPSVVTIFRTSRNDQDVGSGTGFLLDDQGTIATNHHVIEGAGGARIKFMSGATFEKIDLLVDNAVADLALLRIDLKAPVDGGSAPNATALRLSDSDQVVVGERAISIGNPLGLEHTLTDGLVSARRVYEGRAWIQMSVPVSPGNSGGPLFNMRGEVIGITTQQVLGGMFGRAQNLNLAVPVNELKKMIAPTYPQKRPIGASNSGRW